MGMRMWEGLKERDTWLGCALVRSKCDSSMSSYKKAAKSLKKTHRERGQLGSRKHLGLLEKHKDYVLRAKDYHRKQAHLKLLHEKARNRNPDEFYYKMVNTKLKDGRHVVAQPEEKYSPEELKMMQTQDEKYVQMKLNMERKKVERLQASLHMTNSRPNSHIVFVDPSDDNDPSTNTVPDTPTDDPPAGQSLSDGVDHTHSDPIREELSRSYKELRQRQHRCNELSKIARKMAQKKNLMSKERCVKIPGDGSRPTSYKWKTERKR